MTVAPPFGDVLRAWRRRRGVTQQQLADLSTVSVRTIRDLEIGRVARPRRDTLRLICDALGLTGRARADFHAAATRGEEHAWLDESTAPPPAMFDGLVGRAGELGVLREALTNGQRLVALIGLPGAGKSRLAVASARHHGPGGPVMLWGGLDEGELDGGELRVPSLIRAALCTDVAPDARFGAVDQMSALLRNQDAVVVCDGAGPGRFDVAAATALLSSCRGLRIMVTARKPIEVDGMWSLPVAPLAVRDGVRLLLRHVRREQPGFRVDAAGAAAIAELTRRLDGLPAALAGIAPAFLFHTPDELLARVAADPFGALAEADGPDLAADLRATVQDVPEPGRSLLSVLATATPSAVSPTGSVNLARAAIAAPALDAEATMRELTEATGLALGDCVRAIRGLCVRGLLRAGYEGRFSVPHLVRHAIISAKTASLLPGQPPIPAAVRA
ncbi:MAG TPA: helix-turn-helix domain-containing protein [Micromonospora sp.]|nr:helix-turn-helix domain-containing protein [Micromonospora sp.]